MKKKQIIQKLVCAAALLALLTGLLGGCRKEAPPEESTGRPPRETEAQKSQEELFDMLLAELFEDIITSDSITMNYFLADPTRFGIDKIAPTYGEVTSQETIERDRLDNQDIADRLSSFIYDELRPDQQVTYDILLYDLELYELLDASDDYPYYIGAIRPVVGIQVQLPVILAEFHFYTQEDIEIYLELLADTGRYFNDLIEYERERSRRGFFMSDANVDSVIENCESFLGEREDNLMIVVFNERIDQYEGLRDEQREQYKQRNRELVLNNVLPAYETLLAAMRDMRGVGANPGGLADLPDGAEYAGVYLRYKAGTHRTPKQVDAWLEELMDSTMTEIRAALAGNQRLSEGYFSGALGNIRDDTPENYLAELEAAIALDFPAIRPTRYVVREVSENMQEHVSPAFYLTAALDAYDDNVIYINPPSISDNMSLYTTLAHEGFPGHMYQTVYYLQQSPQPLRTVLGDWGYTEGWATYVEYQSYFYAGLSTAEADFLRLVNLFDLLFITRLDLGVNALGWDVNEVASLCRQLGIMDRDVAESVYGTVTGNPLLYLPYCLGYLEFISLREEAEGYLGGDFDLMEFHRFLLDFGPAPFPVIRNYMLEWMEAQTPEVLAPAA